MINIPIDYMLVDSLLSHISNRVDLLHVEAKNLEKHDVDCDEKEAAIRARLNELKLMSENILTTVKSVR